MDGPLNGGLSPWRGVGWPNRQIVRLMLEDKRARKVILDNVAQENTQLAAQVRSEKPSLLHLDLKANTLTLRPVQLGPLTVDSYQIEDVTGKLKDIWTKVKPYLVGGAVGSGTAVAGQKALEDGDGGTSSEKTEASQLMNP